MRKKLVNVALISVLGISLSGCLSEPQPVNLYQPIKEEVTLKNNQLGQVYNGAVILKNGSKIFDQEGDIIASFDKDNELFYILNIKDKAIYKVKNSSQVLIKEFKANAFNLFTDNNKVVLCISLKGNNEFGLYDNIYEFDGKEFKIINKNIDLSGSVYTSGGNTLYKTVTKSGLYYIETWYTVDNHLKKQIVTNILTGFSLDISTIKTNYKLGYPRRILGIRNNIIYYIYNSVTIPTDQYFIEAYDLNTNQTHTLYSDINKVEKKLQFVRSGNEVALKIFNNPELKTESVIYKHTQQLESKYNNEPAKIIALNTLKEANNISNDFTPIPLFSGYENITGANISTTAITFTIWDLHNAVYKNLKSRNLKPLF